jgi:hypothetical protein
MSHFAEIDSNNKVIHIVVGDNAMPNEGLDWITSTLGGRWIQTSYNGNIRFNYAGIGYTYDEVRDAFIAPKCHDEAVLDEATCRWSCANAAHNSIL